MKSNLRRGQPIGEEHPCAKLSEEAVRNILEQLEWREAALAEAARLENKARQLRDKAARMSMPKLAERYGVNRNAIRKIWAGESWTHVI